MGNCLSSSCTHTFIHPLLGSAEEVELLNRRLIRIVDFTLTEVKLKEWENNVKLLEEKKPELLEVFFIPISYNVTATCSLSTRVEFYFQNYPQNLILEKQEKERKGKRFSQERIKEIGKFLFEVWEKNPELEEELTLENILLNDDGKMKIALRKYIPVEQIVELNSSFRWSKRTKMTEETDYATSPRFSLINFQFQKNNLLANICSVLLSLVSDDARYSSSFATIICQLRKMEKNQQMLKDYFLDKVEKTPRNYFLDVPYIESFPEKSNDTSLFMVTESGWTDFNNFG